MGFFFGFPYVWGSTAWHFDRKKDNSILIWDFFFFFLLHWTVCPLLPQPFPLSFSHENLNFLLPLIPLLNHYSPMAKTLISSSPFVGSSLPSLSRHLPLHTLPHRRHLTTRVNFSFHQLPPVHTFHSSLDFQAIVSRTEGLLYTLADAAVAVDSTLSAAATSTSPDTAVQKNGGWFGFISDAMEVVLKVSFSPNSTPLVLLILHFIWIYVFRGLLGYGWCQAPQNWIFRMCIHRGTMNMVSFLFFFFLAFA